MDQKKIRDFVQQAHPKRRILTNDVPEAADWTTGDDRDVDAGQLKLSTWKKFGKPPGRSTGTSDTPMAPDSGNANAREKFRPRTLTGGIANPSARPTRSSSDASATSPRQHAGAGKIALKRLEIPGSTSNDGSQDSLDVLVDEDAGIIGESDSGPEKPRQK